MLSEFRSTDITWDKATSRIYSPVTANESDENGRKLVVQIVNGGQVEDLTGAALHLYWETRDKLHDGLDVFKAVNLKKGEFELSYTRGMLSNKGVLNANLVLIDTSGRVVSEQFKITVKEGINNDAIQSENSFSSLTQALITIGPRLNSLTAQVQHKVGGGKLASMADMGQDVKEAMTGGSVAVVGVNSVGTVNLVNNAVTSKKRTPLGSEVIFRTSIPIDYDTVEETITFPKLTDFVYLDKSSLLSSSETVVPVLPGVDTYYSAFTIWLNPTTKEILASYTANPPEDIENWLLAGVGRKGQIIHLNGNFTVDGLSPVKTKPYVDMVRFINPMDGTIPNVDTENQVITFKNDTILVWAGGFAVLPDTTIDLSVNNSSAKILYFNTVTKAFRVSGYNSSAQKNEVHILTLRTNSDNVPNVKTTVSILSPYTINGKLYGMDQTEQTEQTGVVFNPLHANVKAVAHRGYSLEAPENTLPAYKLAKDKGFTYVECDVEWTSDNIPVLLHDGTIDRTSNGTGNIKDLTLEEVKLLDFGSWKNPTYTNTAIPTFEEFIIACKKWNLHPYIEMKGSITAEHAEIMMDIVIRLGMKRNVSWISFAIPSLQMIADLDPNARLGYVGSISTNFINAALTIKTDVNEVFIDSSGGAVTQELVEQSLINGMDVEVWTVNTSSSVTGLVEKGISGITTDYLNVAEILSLS